MILGDSLQVMASLAEREGLRGKVPGDVSGNGVPHRLLCYVDHHGKAYAWAERRRSRCWRTCQSSRQCSRPVFVPMRPWAYGVRMAPW